MENYFTNLSHLESLTVTILGTDVDDITTQYDEETVSDGIVSLIDGDDYNFVKRAVVGLPSRYILRPMRMDVVTQGGTTHGSIKKTAEIAVSLYKARDVYYGSSLDELHIIPDTKDTLFTGDTVLPFDGGFTLDDPLYISGNGAFSCTVRAIIPRVKKTGR